ncbi:MAG: hypothetical protein ACKOXB_03705 [Flavobacteriales bacterium]
MKNLLLAAAMLYYGFVCGNIHYSVKSGNWNEGSTWSSGMVPISVDSAIVNTAHEIIMNQDSAKVFWLEVYGALKWNTIKSTTAGYLVLRKNAMLSSNFFIGTLNVDSALIANDGSAAISNIHLYCKNNCIVKGELIFNSESGNKLFNNLEIRSGGKFSNNTSTDPTILGNINNNGTFKACSTSGCTYHFPNSTTFSGDSLIALPRIESRKTMINKGFLKIDNALNGNPALINEGKLLLGLSPLTFHVSSFNTAATGNTVVYTDTSEQNIFLPDNGFYENIILENGAKRLQNALMIKQALIIKKNCILKSDTFKITAKGTAFLQMDSLSTLWIGNNDNKKTPGFPQGFSAVNLHKNSTVRYQSMGDENIESTVVYGNLNIDDGNVTQSIKKLSTDLLHVKGNLTLEESSLLLQCNHCNITINGDWEGVGNLKMDDGVFHFRGNGKNEGLLYPGKGKVIYDGANDQIIKVGTYYNLDISKNSGKAVLKGNNYILDVSKTLRLSKGTFEMGNESVLINDSIIVEDALVFTSTKQSKIFKNFIITHSGKVNMKAAASIDIKGNWSNDGSFTAGKGEIVFSDSIQNQIINGNTFFYDVSIRKNSKNVTLQSPINVSHNLLIYSGKINMGDHNIMLGSGAKINGENARNYISGNEGRIQIVKNISGEKRDSIGNIGLIFESTSNMGLTTISRSHQSISVNGTPSIRRIYEIHPSNNSNLNATVIFHFLPAEMNTTQKTKLELWKSEDGSSGWQKINGTLDTLNNTFTVGNIPSFSTWTFTESEVPLPLQWIDFTVQRNESSLLLKWQTNDERNTDSFTIQQSETGYNFTDITKIPACGNCAFQNDYTHTLALPENTTYLRIKSIDYDGASAYSEIKVFAVEESNQRIYFDCSGKMLGNTLENLPEGIYIYITDQGERGKTVINLN